MKRDLPATQPARPPTEGGSYVRQPDGLLIPADMLPSRSPAPERDTPEKDD